MIRPARSVGTPRVAVSGFAVMPAAQMMAAASRVVWSLNSSAPARMLVTRVLLRISTPSFSSRFLA